MINYDFIQHIKYIDYNCIKGFDYEKYVLLKLKDYYDIKEIYLWKDIPEELLIESGIILNNDLQTIKQKYNTNKSWRLSRILDKNRQRIAISKEHEDLSFVNFYSWDLS